MNAVTPDVIVVRGAPGSGKSATSKCLAARLGRATRLEVDAIRAMVIPVDWTNQAEHIGVLSLVSGLVVGFLQLGHRPVIVVDTFSGDKLSGFLAALKEQRGDLAIRSFALVPTQEVLRARVEARLEGQFKDVGICAKLNDDIVKFLQPGERLIDNSSLSPQETADLILLDCAADEATVFPE